MPNVNTSKSTYPPDGGNVEEPYKTTPQICSDGVRVTPVSKSSKNQAINHTEFAYLPDESHFKTQLDPSRQIQTDANVKEVNTNQTDRDRVIRELGVTSTAFIGPTCRPDPSIEQELCEFYKELEEVDKVDGDANTKSVEEHGRHSSSKSKSNLPNRTDSPVVVTDHGRAYRPYPGPHERNQKDPKGWRHRLQWNMDDFGGGGHPEPLYPPPPWVQFIPPPTSGGPIMYPPDMRPQENFHGYNNSRGPWEGPPLPSNRWHERSSFQSHERPGFSEEYDTPLSHWQQHNHEKDHYQHLELILLRGVPGSGKSSLAR